jgi:hypothetical protein
MKGETRRSFMRIALAFVMFGSLWASEAVASSFVVLEPSPGPGSPSIVTLGTPATLDVTTLPDDPKDEPDVAIGHVDRPARPDPADSDIVTISPSIVAMGVPEVTSEKVAAIGGEKHGSRREPPLPMVIRGGVVGDAFSPVTTAAPVEQPHSGQEANQAPSGGSQPAAPPNGMPEQPVAPPPPPVATPQATTKVE